MVKWNEIIKSEINKTQAVGFELLKNGMNPKDVRFSFYELFQNLYNFYYRIYLNQDSRSFKEASDKIYKNIQGQDDKSDKLNMIANANSNLIISTWSIFELCISQICKALLDKDSISKLLKSNYNRIMKVLKDSVELGIKDKLLKNHQTKFIEHVSINLKMDKIFSLMKYENYKRDKEFLLFYGKLRNSIHSNYVYYGNPYKYNFKDHEFIFTPNRPIKQKPINWEQDLTIFYLTVELKEVYSRIINNFNYQELIFDPSYADKK